MQGNKASVVFTVISAGWRQSDVSGERLWPTGRKTYCICESLVHERVCGLSWSMSLLFKLKTLSEPPSATGSCSDCWVITSTLKSSAFSTISINSALLCGASPKKERKKGMKEQVSFPSNGEFNGFLDMWSNTGFVLTDVKPGSNQPPSSVHPSPWLIADSRGGVGGAAVGKGGLGVQIAGCLLKAPLLSAYLLTGLFALIGQMRSIRPWKASAASITDLSRSRTQVHRPYKCNRVLCEAVRDTQSLTWGTLWGHQHVSAICGFW